MIRNGKNGERWQKSLEKTRKNRSIDNIQEEKKMLGE